MAEAIYVYFLQSYFEALNIWDMKGKFVLTWIIGSLDLLTPSQQDKRRAACPGFYRMPTANDGLLCRLKLSLSQITTPQVKCLADAILAYGNNCLELTNRGNVQLRGIKEDFRLALIDHLTMGNLAPKTQQGDDVRNVMISSTAGIDPFAKIDTRPIAVNLLDMLQSDAIYQRLSPKFSLFIDGQESTAPLFHINDIWLSAINADFFLIGIDSAPLVIDCNDKIIGAIQTQDVRLTIRTILDVFLSYQHHNPAIKRIRDITKVGRLTDFIADIKTRLPGLDREALYTNRTAANHGMLGIGEQIQENRFYVSIKPPLGRLNNSQLNDLLALTTYRQENSPLIVSTWQSIIIPNCTLQESETILENAQQHWITDKTDTLSAIRCCVGAPYCAAGKANIQYAARELAGKLERSYKIHLSGCEKSCATNTAKPLTLLAIDLDHYNLYAAEEGSLNKFGRLIAQNKTIDDIAMIINNDRQEDEKRYHV